MAEPHSHCPSCGSCDPTATPEAGAFAVCGGCGMVLVYADVPDGLQLEVVSQSDLDRLLAWPEGRAVVMRVRSDVLARGMGGWAQ